ncbi:MAG: DNA-protecting protein DprA [Actinobacteria bacterium]|nr:DNA-protecting protein DprA [Actinomycetota bacterium]
MSAPAKREVAAAALVGLAEMSPARLAALLRRWPDPLEAVAAIQAGRAAAAIQMVDPELRGPIARQWALELDLERAEATMAARGTRALVASDPGFPIDEQLPGCPAVLLVEGSRLDCLDAPRVAVVGTRAATPHGLDDARLVGAALAEAEVTVVSGMAIGIDGAAHQGALDAGGLAVGVIATGLDVVYPRRHFGLFERVRRSGLIVSESAFKTGPLPARFPVRNRIIAGLADVTVVVEATAAGGARITAEHAMRFGRHVFAIPGSRRNPSAAGCNALIADGAHPLLDPSDIAIALGMSDGSRRRQREARVAPSGDGAAVHQALGGEPATTDQLVSRTGLTVPKIAVAVAGLEREGWVVRSRGMVWPR